MKPSQNREYSCQAYSSGGSYVASRLCCDRCSDCLGGVGGGRADPARQVQIISLAVFGVIRATASHRTLMRSKATGQSQTPCRAKQQRREEIRPWSWRLLPSLRD